MNIQTEKIALAKRLLDTDNEALLQQVKDIFDANEWATLPDHVKAGIENARQQAREGLLTSHEDILKKYARYQ